MAGSGSALAFAIALAASAGVPTPASAAGFCDSRPANVLLDVDANGVPETVCVSDWDRDGTLEMDDIQDAVQALVTTAPKNIYVLPGSYQPPATPALRPGRSDGLIELKSHTSLICETPGTRLLGPLGIDASQNYAVVANADHTLGNDDVHIRGCEIDGGAPDHYSGNVVIGQRMGVYFRRTRNSSVENAFVRHTYHTGLYTSNSHGDHFVDNRIEDAGGYGNSAYGPPYPCIYLFSFGGETIDDFVASGNTMTRCTADGLNTRTETVVVPGAGIRNTLWENNTIQDTGYPVGQGGGSVCLSVRGVDGITIRHNRCVSAGGLYIYPAAGYASDGNLDAVKNVLVEDLTLLNVDAVAGIVVGSHAENLTLRDVRVISTRDDAGNYLPLDCFQLGAPLRGTLFEDLLLVRCGGSGIYELGTQGSGHAPGEQLTFRRVTIDRVDMADPTDTQTRSGLHLRGPHQGLVLEDIESDQASRSEIEFERHLEDARLERIHVNAINPNWVGSFAEAQAPACTPALARRWITTQNGRNATDCDFSAGTTGATPARCRCNGSAWSWYPPDQEQPGIVFGDADQPSARVALRDVEVDNARDLPGVRMTSSVQGVEVTNLLGVDDSPATELDQNSAIQVLDALVDIRWNGVRCVGTDPSRPCVEVLRDAWDWDADGVPNAIDNCISAVNPDQADFDRDGAGRACDPDDDGDLLLDAYETGTGHYVSPTSTGTNPLDADSDDDGSLDGIEVQAGSDPNNAASRPPAVVVPALGPGGELLAALGLLAVAAGRLRR